MARNRAYRRAQKERARAKAVYLIDRIWGLFHPRLDRTPQNRARAERWRIEKIQQMTDTRKPCSCHMCGNPRRWFGDLTLAELKAIDAYRDSMYEQE
jgi:hypothetical protein